MGATGRPWRLVSGFVAGLALAAAASGRQPVVPPTPAVVSLPPVPPAAPPVPVPADPLPPWVPSVLPVAPVVQPVPKGGDQPRPGDGEGKDDPKAEPKKDAAEVKKEKAEPKDAKKDDGPKQWVVGENLGMTARWNHGLHVQSADKAFRVHPVGRLQWDNAFMTAGSRVQFAPGGVGRVDDATAFRRLRIGVEGTLWEVFDFWVEPDYFNTFNAQGANQGEILANTPAATDMWGQLTHIPWVGNFRFGSIKPVYSFEHLTSSRFLSFMERSLMFDAFVGGVDNGFQPGFILYNWAESRRATWQLSMSRNTTNVFGSNVGDGEFNYVARGTVLPVYHEDGREIVHLGLSVNHRQLDDRQDRFRVRPMVRNGPAAGATALVDLRVAGQSRDMVMPEFAAVVGPLSIQSEYLGAWVHDAAVPATGAARRDRGTLFFQGFYVDVMYFLTGESRPYDTNWGTFTRVVPFENFFLVRDANGCLARGLGAWQVGARYSYLDLNDRDVGGGIVHDLTLGLNWFWNPNMKWQYNYSLARRDVPGALGNGIVQGFGIRFAMDF